MSQIKVRLKSYFWNKNYFGTHFGGSLYSMSDPFFVFLLAHHLGDEYIIWDKSAKIDFIKAVKEPVFEHFSISDDQIQEIKKLALENFSNDIDFQCHVKTEENQIVANITKTLYVRRKDAKQRFSK